MATRPIDLPDEVIRIAEAHVAAGRFATVQDVVRAAVEAFERDAQLARLGTAIDEGDASGTFAGDPFAAARRKHGLDTAH